VTARVPQKGEQVRAGNLEIRLTTKGHLCLIVLWRRRERFKLYAQRLKATFINGHTSRLYLLAGICERYPCRTLTLTAPTQDIQK
jgi:hypothetical protein